MRITPIVWMLNPCVEMLTAKRRIAPTAMRKREVPSPIEVHHSRKPAFCGYLPDARARQTGATDAGPVSHSGYACDVPWRRFRRSGRAKETDVSIGDPRLDGWETVSTFEEQATAIAWRDRLRELGVDACCVADRPLDRFGRGDVYLVVPPDQWSRANEMVENLGD